MTDAEILGSNMTYSCDGGHRSYASMRVLGVLLLVEKMTSGDKLYVEAHELVLFGAVADTPLSTDDLASGLRELVASGSVAAWRQGKKIHDF